MIDFTLPLNLKPDKAVEEWNQAQNLEPGFFGGKAVIGNVQNDYFKNGELHLVQTGEEAEDLFLEKYFSPEEEAKRTIERAKLTLSGFRAMPINNVTPYFSASVVVR